MIMNLYLECYKKALDAGVSEERARFVAAEALESWVDRCREAQEDLLKTFDEFLSFKADEIQATKVAS
jgi:hypothetical protein